MAKKGTKKAAKNEVAKKGEENDILSLLAADAGAGFEQAHADSFAKPALKILQKLSPECDKEDDKYVEGAEPGDIFNTVTKELSESVRVNPELYYTTYVEWKPRETGGGIVAEYELAMGQELERGCKIDEKKRRILPNGNILSRTENYIVKLHLESGAYEVAIIRMSGSQISRAKMWNSQMRMEPLETAPGVFVKPPLYRFDWVLGTERQSNDQGNWFGWTFEKGDQIDDVKLIMEIRGDQALYSQNLLTFTPQDDAAVVENAL